MKTGVSHVWVTPMMTTTDPSLWDILRKLFLLQSLLRKKCESIICTYIFTWLFKNHTLPVLTEHTQSESCSSRLWFISPIRLSKFSLWPYNLIPDVHSCATVHTFKWAEGFIVTRVCLKKKMQEEADTTHCRLFLAQSLGCGTLAQGNRSCPVLSGSNARGYFSSLSYIIISLNAT